jgi:FSR family fosmidomycin resistance protein-like MFS transporter
MQRSTSETEAAAASTAAEARPAVNLGVLVALSIAHLLNDTMQSLIPAIYPVIKTTHGLDFGQIGLITMTFQVAASLLQPIVGVLNDRRPQPYSLVLAMAITLSGLLVLAMAPSYPMLLLGAGLVGTGSSVFHPEATRMARLAAAGRLGLGQAMFQIGGQIGSALGPLLAAFVVAARGQSSVAWFSIVALVGMVLLFQVGAWSTRHLAAEARAGARKPAAAAGPREGVALALTILVVLMFSKSAYTSSFGSFYTFYLIEKFKVSVETSQLLLFVYLISSVIGTAIGGPLGDRIGRRAIIWFSILGAAPFALALPFADLTWTVALTVIIAMIMSSAFAAILVYAIELMPTRVGLIGGLFYGLVFAFGGVSAAALGEIVDRTSLDFVYRLCSLIPLVGLLTWFLPPHQPTGRP